MKQLILCFCRIISVLFFVNLSVFVKTERNVCDQSHSFFVPRQVTTNSVFELGLNNYQWYHERKQDDNFYFGFYVTPFFQQSAQSKKLARYFLRNNKESLTFSEVNEDPCNICSLWFGLESDVNSNFNATFSMNPCRRAYGSYFNLLLSKAWEGHQFWFDFAFTAMRVKHELRMCETVQELAGPLSNFQEGTIDQFTSVINALNNTEWCFGKFSQCSLNRSGVDDIQLKLGYDWYYAPETNNHLSPYLVATIPTGKRQRSEFIFEPLVGSKNGSFGIGLNFDYTFYTREEHVLTWLIDAKCRYVFGADQCRSFDLCKNGDWSRYLLVVPQDQTLATQPGINLFSLVAKVTPRGTIDIWTALHWQWDFFNLEVGYDFWWCQKEKVCLKDKIASGFGIFDLAGMNGVPTSASTANISQCTTGSNQAQSDATFVTLTTSDLDVDSAAHPAALSSTLYGAFSWEPTPGDYPFMLGFGGQYEFAHRISALEQWAFWGKLGIVF